MRTNQYREELAELVSAYEKGLYSEGEIASLCMNIICKENDEFLWAAIPDWVKERLIERLKSLSQNDEIITFGNGEPQEVKERLLQAKRWLTRKGVL